MIRSSQAGVTYVVTLYNKAPYVAGVLAAIRAQQGDFPRQYVVVDDGSTDGSGEIAAAILADWPDAVLIRQDNKGPSAATNRGVALARMPYTHIVDGDDILAPYATRLLLRAARESGCGLVYGGGTWYAAPEEIAFPPEPEAVKVRVLEDTLFSVIRHGQSGSIILFETEAFRRAGGCDETVFIQDQSLPQRLAPFVSIGTFGDLISTGPLNEPGRVMKSSAQVLHDQSLSAINTLRNNPDLPPRYRRLVQRRATGRAWKWAFRHRKRGFPFRHFGRFLAARIPFLLLSDQSLLKTLEAFRGDATIRLVAP